MKRAKQWWQIATMLISFVRCTFRYFDSLQGHTAKWKWDEMRWDEINWIELMENIILEKQSVEHYIVSTMDVIPKFWKKKKTQFIILKHSKITAQCMRANTSHNYCCLWHMRLDFAQISTYIIQSRAYVLTCSCMVNILLVDSNRLHHMHLHRICFCLLCYLWDT